MDIVIISEFTSTFSVTDNDRFLYLVKKMCDDHQVEIVTSDFCHEKKQHRNRTEAEWPFDITFLHEDGYPRNVCLKRFYSHIRWGINVEKYLKKRKKPDVVYCAVPSLSGPNRVAKYCEKNGIRFIIDVQDLWPEAYKMVLHIPVISDVLFAPFTWLANGIYKRADDIVAVSETYANRALEKNTKCTSAHAVYLGTDLNTFDQNAREGKKREKPAGETWLGYCGTLGSSYDLTVVFKAMELLNEKTLKFIVMGDGPRLEEFKAYAQQKNLPVFFAGRLPYNDMCALLNECDVVVNPITGGAAQSIINKHADYVASGKPVINTQESAEYRRLVSDYHMGINCDNGNAQQIADAIVYLLKHPEEKMTMGSNARKCAEERFDRAKAYCEIIDLL